MANRSFLSAVLLLVVLCNAASSTQYLTGTHGCFASQGYPSNYPNNARQTYKIIVTPGSKILLRFVAFAVEDHHQCGFDSLEIREKDNSVARKLCGTNIPGDFISQDNELTIEFASDASVTLSGFFATFVATNRSSPTPSTSLAPSPSPSPIPVHGGWCSFNWTACSVSCGYGQQYGYRSCNCPAPANGGQHCYGSSYQYRNCSLGPCPSSTPLPPTTPSPSCGKFMTSLNDNFTSPGYPNNYPDNARCQYEISVPRDKKIVLDFHSFNLERGYDYLQLSQMVGGSMNFVARLTGDSLTTRRFISAENKFSLLFTSDGSVTRSGFRAGYTTVQSGSPPVNGNWCSWFPVTPCSASCGYGHQSFRRYCNCPAPSSGGSNCTGPDTRFDSCYQGHCPTSSSTILSSSTTMPTPSPSPVPTCSPQIHTAPSGVIKSPGYPANYQHNANCVYNITVEDGKAIKIDFTTFNVENGASCPYDYLAIYEGDSLVQMGKLCGDGAKSYTSRRNKIFMRFVSDGSVNGQGFYGTYQTVDPAPVGGATVNDPSCGIRKVSQSRVIGGTDAAKGAWPWQIGMYRNGGFICGGTLIAPNWVLTAAHCVVSGGTVGSASDYEIVVGDLHREMNDTTEMKHQVELIIAHPNYDGNVINNDIALMKLRTPVIMNDHVITACIPEKTDVVRIGATCFITGWGKIQHPGGSHTMLQQALLPVLNSTVCQAKIDKLGWGLKITDQMVCAGEEGSKKSGCHGDSGGPFVCPDPTGRFYLHGDVSWGSGRCDTSEAYSVFARVTEFVDWIKASLRDF